MDRSNTVKTSERWAPRTSNNSFDQRLIQRKTNSASESQRRSAFNGRLTNKILTSLPGPDFAELLPYLEPVSLSRRQKLFEFGQTIDYVYFPETAVISHLYFLADGSSAAATIIGSEGVVGLSAILDSRPASYWTQVTLAGTAVRVSAEIIRNEFSRGRELQQLMLSYTRSRLVQLSLRAVCNGRHLLKERLATWLLMIRDRVDDDPIDLTHEHLANHLGSRRAGVSTTGNSLADLGIIRYSRGRLRVIDHKKLEDVACECYGAMQEFS